MLDIKTNVKRGLGKNKIDISNPEFYEEYKRFELSKNKIVHPIQLYRKVIDSFNKKLVENIILNNETFEFPYKLGYLGIIKYEVIFDLNNKNLWKVDYKKSKEIGQIVYFDQPYRYKWKWDKFKKLKGKRWYRFQPSRNASRSITKALNNNKSLDYFEKVTRN